MKSLMALWRRSRRVPNLRTHDLDDKLLADIGLSRNGDRLGQSPVEETIETARRPPLIVIVNAKTMTSSKRVDEKPGQSVLQSACRRQPMMRDVGP
ncbi:MAG: hypothetical protein AB7I34_07490 [Rhizobiaceae bacterium]